MATHPTSDPLQMATHLNVDTPKVDFVNVEILKISTVVKLYLIENYFKLLETFTFANSDKSDVLRHPMIDRNSNLNTLKFNNFRKKNNLKNSSNNVVYTLQEIFIEDLVWDTPVVQHFILIYWVKLTIQEKEESFIATRDIYEKYRKNCNALIEKSVLGQSSFYKLIWNSLLTAKIMYVRSQENGKKGIRGVQFKITENHSKKYIIKEKYWKF